MRWGVCAVALVALAGVADAGPAPDDLVALFKENCLDQKASEFDLSNAARANKHFLLRQKEIDDLASPTVYPGLLRTSGYRLPGSVIMGIQAFDKSDPALKVRCTLRWSGNVSESPGAALVTLLGMPASEQAGSVTWAEVEGAWDSVVLSYKTAGGVFNLYAQAK